MENNNNIEEIFKLLQHDFDVASPHENHEERFLAKLKSLRMQPKQEAKKVFVLWRTIMAVAASLLLFLVLTFTFESRGNTSDLASVSPEMAKTQSFFTATIEQELQQLKKENAPDVQPLITDALKQLDVLEKDYDNLKIDLNKSGNDKRVIYAMIANFQNRISILQNVLETIENVKQLKNTSNENKTTI